MFIFTSIKESLFTDVTYKSILLESINIAKITLSWEMIKLGRTISDSIWNFSKTRTCTFLGAVCTIFALMHGNLLSVSAVGLAVFMLMIFIAVWRGLERKYVIRLMLVCGFILRLVYIVYTGVEQRQHDVHAFGGADGHAAYIEYFYNNMRLPDFDPTTVWQFYHPPLHHIICAIWLKIQTAFGIEYVTALEGLQFLTLFYSLVCMVMCYRILRWFKLEGFSLYMPLSIICFHPTFIIMAGSVNNDILSVAFSLGAILCTLKWWDKPKMRNIIKIALCIGLGMSTKLSTALIAPAVAVVFLIKLIQDKSLRKQLITQYAVFGIICIPLGLWWGIRNLILFGTEITYVPKMSETNWQYNGNYPVLQRFLDFSFYQFKNLFISWNRDYGLGVEPYLEFNPTIGLFKTAVFGEYYYYLNGNTLLIAGTSVLLYSGIAIALLSVICALYCLVERSFTTRKRIGLWMLAITAVVILVSYYNFCISYAQTCTMNFRYAVPLIPISAVFIGTTLKKLQDDNSRILHAFKITTAIISSLFCVSSAVFYIAIGAQ